ncbi:hypothetical protein AK812_SmicGene34086 [Symbiodinium microadriaticum]|uniref:ZZ-type domain-containing protein n=1 Tax=Symbiodinium microadriaticum TaxID=2951 RepID=A0A1Q9CPX7_SYMMI|nr:hypothetical protein AK812_SmicGene34086 [Symbiodinium microadriaticum]
MVTQLCWHQCLHMTSQPGRGDGKVSSLAPDPSTPQVRHESLPQWWYVGSSLEFRTNKGKIFRHVAGWGSGEEEDMVCFKAKPGKCIMRLLLHDGELRGIIEEDCHVAQGAELEMFMAYWTQEDGHGSSGMREVKCPKGHAMRQDWSRTGHICDECSRRGTAARCGGGCDYDLCEICYKHHAEGWASAVQKRGFASRDAAMTFASRNGAPLGGVLLLGPLRLELEDHPWLDGWRELREASTGWCRHLRSLFRQARGLNPGPILPTAGIDRTGVPAAPDRSPAGLVVDVRRGTRIRAWGPQERLAMCEKAAADAGEFNVSEWATNSSSVKGLLAWARRTGPLVWRVLSLLDWRRLFMTSRRNDTCFSIGCQSRALESRNLQLALLLARCNLLGLWHGPMDFDDLEEQEIVSASNQRALRSEPDLDLGEDDEDDVDLQQPTLEALTCLVLQEREKRKRAERALKKVASRLQQLQNRPRSPAAGAPPTYDGSLDGSGGGRKYSDFRMEAAPQWDGENASHARFTVEEITAPEGWTTVVSIIEEAHEYLKVSWRANGLLSPSSRSVDFDLLDSEAGQHLLGHLVLPQGGFTKDERQRIRVLTDGSINFKLVEAAIRRIFNDTLDAAPEPKTKGSYRQEDDDDGDDWAEDLMEMDDSGEVCLYLEAIQYAGELMSYVYAETAERWASKGKGKGKRYIGKSEGKGKGYSPPKHGEKASASTGPMPNTGELFRTSLQDLKNRRWPSMPSTMQAKRTIAGAAELRLAKFGDHVWSMWAQILDAGVGTDTILPSQADQARARGSMSAGTSSTVPMLNLGTRGLQLLEPQALETGTVTDEDSFSEVGQMNADL